VAWFLIFQPFGTAGI